MAVVQNEMGSLLARRDLMPLEVRFFLHMGYFPHYQKRYKLNFMNLSTVRYDSWTEDMLKTEALQLFKKALADNFQTNKKHIVPISGGLDSRAILAGLLEFTPAENIETYSYGVSGSYDYDLGALVADRAGVSHRAIDLSAHQWTQDELLDQAIRNDGQTFLFHHAPWGDLQCYEQDVIWSGYIGDLVCGGHAVRDLSMSLQAAKTHYIQKRAESKAYNFTRGRDDIQAMAGLLQTDTTLDDHVSAYEAVLLSEVASVTAPHVLSIGLNYVTPFINNEFFDLMLSMPQKYRRGRSLFISLMRESYSNLFDLPVKECLGLGFGASKTALFSRRLRNKFLHMGRKHMPFLPLPASSNMNYFYFSRTLIEQTYLQTIVKSNFSDLNDRGVLEGIDLERIVQRHLSGLYDYGDAIKNLLSLEMNYKAVGR